jgi:NAD(P)-dependent dehydrogenase (short-subunit alcohol dehydrogenase family)
VSVLKQALIIGASRGLGHAMAEALAKGGTSVTATVRDVSRSPFAEAPGIVTVALDVNDPQGGERLVSAHNQSRFDLVLVNAGIKGPDHQDVSKANAAEITDLFFTNAISPVRLARGLLPLVRSGGVLAFMSSRMGSVALNETGSSELYRASKAALNSLARSFAVRDALPAGVGVLMLHPGWVQTDMGGASAPVTIADSIGGLTQVIETALDHPAHRFIDYQGEELAW